MSGYRRNAVVQWLLSRAYGQGGTVAVPSAGTPGPVPLGSFPPGIDDVLEHVTSRHRAWTPAIPEIDWCILVGGPGNGKSEALRSLANRLSTSLPARVSGQPVPRTLPVDWPSNVHRLASGLDMAFVNDASIPRHDVPSDGSAPGSLFHDITNALSRIIDGRPTSLFVNVNRGILIEERSALRSVTDWSANPIEQQLAANVVQWLAAPSESTGKLEDVLRPKSEAPHYGEFTLRLVAADEKSHLIRVRVVFLDMLSLLEPRPGSSKPVVDFTRSPPEVAPYQTLGRLVSRDVTRDTTVAGALLATYADASRWEGGDCKDLTSGQLCSARSLCPFAENAAWLRDSSLRQRLLDTLRAAEIAANRRLTYRDLLGHISLAVIGPPAEDWLTGKHPCQWVEDNHKQISTGSGQKGAAVRLARHRVYSNLYPGGGFRISRETAARSLKEDSVFSSIVDLLVPSGEAARVQPFEAAFASIDPARDTEAWNGFRKRVLDAVESLDVIEPALTVASWPDLPAAASSQIERQLDRVLREEIAAELPKGTRTAVSRVRVLRRWRAAVLLRHIGTALGHVRYAEAIGAWLAEQERALLGGQRLRLGDGINNLIIPSGPGKVYLAPLRPRTYCLSGELPRDTLLVTVQPNELDVSIVAQGDALVAEVRIRHRAASTDPLATLTIDLAVARESLLHTDGKTGSFTEIGETAFARIERARASLISRERLLRVNAWFTDQKGELYQLVPNPAGASTLRVERG